MMFSVIIPLYNKAHYILATLKSVLAQTFKDLEVIVVDDGSTDGSADVVRTIVDSRLLLISQPNGGVSRARNTGIKAASGEWIAFIDADDQWDDEYLEQMYALIQRNPEENFFACARHGRPIPQLPEESIIEDAAAWGIIYWTGSVVVRRAMFDKVGLFREGISLGEDRDMWLRIGLATPTVFLNRELACYSEEIENNLTSTVNPDNEFPYWEWYALPTRFPESLRRYATHQLIHLAEAYLHVGNHSKALRTIFRCKGTSDLKARIQIIIHALFKR